MNKREVLLPVIFIIFIILASFTTAQNGKQYHLKLLAVQENNPTNFTGSDADLYLELKDGSGRVFLETFPLTKADTQISTRFAKEIACKHFKLDCDEHDFIYTIKARSNIIGGPSAGAAIAALTTIAMLDLDYDESVTITGTINSGAIVGPVAGIKEKLAAAAEAGLQKVMISKGSAVQRVFSTDAVNQTGDKQNNQTEQDDLFNFIEYGKENLSLEVVEVMDLDEVLFHLTGVDLNRRDTNIIVDEQYTEIMKGLRGLLCDRRDNLVDEYKKEGMSFSEEFLNKTRQKEVDEMNATLNQDFYSAASFCFGASIMLRQEYYSQKNLSEQNLDRLFLILSKKTEALEKKMAEEKIETISDLQTLMVSQERLNDVKNKIKTYQKQKASEQKSEQESERDNVLVIENRENRKDPGELLAYAEERFFSTMAWMQFFSMKGKKFMIDNELLEHSCLQKISEAEERYQYTGLFLGSFNVIHIQEKINNAKEAMAQGEFPLCLITASQAKGDANAIISAMGLTEELMDDFFNSKKTATEKVIAENSAEGIFPIMGYSYYQYANSLKEQEKYTALLYLEYALEISDLAIYFPEELTFLQKIEKKFKPRRELIFIAEGFGLGVIVTLLVVLSRKNIFRKKKKSKMAVK